MPELSNEKIALFDRLLAGKLQDGDTEALIAWLGTDQPDKASIELILSQLQNEEWATQELSPELVQRLEQRLPLIFAAPASKGILRTIVGNKWLRYAAALIILVGLAIGAQQLFFKENTPEGKPLTEAELLKQIEPGRDGAILTLVDGSQLLIDSMGNGLLTTQNGTKVLLRNGQLIYDGEIEAPVAVGYNTMSTPKGRQFKMVLPDGTKVWLNAASSIRYPIAFTGDTREVAITGEAYFEVAHQKEKPFRVQMHDGTKVEVLGTHFNINSYDNEASINTTLLEGSVRVIGRNGHMLLQPGQQAQSQPSGNITLQNQVNVEQVMAWKNGLFDFQDARLEEVMRQLERWYDIEVSYESGIPDLEFYGKMGKDLSLETVLNGLKKSNVKFRMEEGRKLVVLE